MGPNFTMNLTWRRLILLSLVKNQPKNTFQAHMVPTTGDWACAPWLLQQLLVHFLGTPCRYDSIVILHNSVKEVTFYICKRRRHLTTLWSRSCGPIFDWLMAATGYSYWSSSLRWQLFEQLRSWTPLGPSFRHSLSWTWKCGAWDDWSLMDCIAMCSEDTGLTCGWSWVSYFQRWLSIHSQGQQAHCGRHHVFQLPRVCWGCWQWSNGIIFALLVPLAILDHF